MRNILLSLLFVALGVTSAFAQDRTVSGRVTDGVDGLPGVNVILKGTSRGVTSDIDGNYRIAVPGDGGILVFSYIGMLTQEAEIGARSVIDVEMSADAKQLTEVVVVGYGTQLKQDLTGNIASVSSEDIQNIPVNSFESAIQGKTSGVFIEKSSGKLGEGIKMRVRGTSSISGNNQPLYVIDGIPITTEDQSINNNQPTNPLADINFNDIESIEVLKDAYASSIYGSRASNGVVLITTKRGKTGKPQINISYQVGTSQPARLREWMNADEYREIYTEATLRYLGVDPVTATAEDVTDAQEFLEAVLVEGFASDMETDTDWQSEAFSDDAGFSQLDVNMSGGNDATQYYAGISYNDQRGILIDNNFTRASARLNLDQKVTDKLKLGMGLNVVRSELDRVSNDNAFATPLQLIALAPTQPAYLDDGTANPSTIYYNGLTERDNSTNTTTVFRTLGNINASYQIVDGLTARVEYGLDILDQQEDIYKGRITQDGSPGGQVDSRAVRVINYTTTGTMDYSKTFSERHSVNLIVGSSYQESNDNSLSIQATGFPTDDLNTVASAAENIYQFSSADGFSFLSYFGRFNYKLNNRYLIGFSGRMDGSSKFGENNRYGFFPAASAGWIVSEESFLAGNSLLSFLKLRASYGLTGNAPSANRAHLGTYAGAPYTTTSGLRPWALANPDLRWEKTTQLNIGVDLGFFDDRITLEGDYYIKNTTDLLLSRPIPAISGYNSIFENVGELNNKGFELVLNTQNLVGQLTWSTSFNIGIPSYTFPLSNFRVALFHSSNR
jgi:TonB-linked SusC/RagA family outer membrane protein